MLELIVSTELGGGPRHVYDLVMRLPRDKFFPSVAAPDNGPHFERFRAAGITIERVRLDGLSPSALWQVMRIVSRQRVDLIHSHGKGAGLYGRLVARLTDRPSVHTFHGIHRDGYGRGTRGLYAALERTLGRWSQAVIALSDEQREEVVTLGFASADRCVVVPNGIDLAELDASARQPYARSAYGACPGELVVGCIARFDPVKRLDVLVDATAQVCRRFPNVRLVLVGSGPLERPLRRRAARLGIERRVSFPGALPDAVRCYRGWDVYVTMSAREGLPYALLEAMGSSLPVVASDVPGHREVIRDGMTGVLVSAEPAAAAAAIARVLEDGTLRRELGVHARRTIERDFTVEWMVKRISEVYRRVARPREEPPSRRLGSDRSVVG